MHLGAAKWADGAREEPLSNAIAVVEVPARQHCNSVGGFKGEEANSARLPEELARACVWQVVDLLPIEGRFFLDTLIEEEEQLVVLGRDLAEEQVRHLRSKQATRQPPL